jgi:N-succinyldiaminopimelate aminotransferase
MTPNLQKLQLYAFEKLNRLKAEVRPPPGLDHIALSIGEPKHPTPKLITDEVLSHLHSLSTYPTTRGTPTLRQTIADWLVRRFRLEANSVDPERHVLPVNGTREALFAFAQAVVDTEITPAERPLVLMPNPFYQIYEGAALLAGAEPRYLACTADHGFIPSFSRVSAATWQRCQLLYLCSPGNPTGATIPEEVLRELIALADEYDFLIAADECYSEIYFDEARPPVGLLQVAAAMGRHGFDRCVVFHSLSKRSNAPGLRSGFVAGDAAVIASFLRYRTYHGCAMPLHHQAASAKAWRDERHVEQNRRRYREKLAAFLEILDGVLEVEQPTAGFYLWPQTPIPDQDFARLLYQRHNVTVLPGSFLSRTVAGSNPGSNRVRMALVAPIDECIDAAKRIKRCVKEL